MKGRKYWIALGSLLALLMQFNQCSQVSIKRSPSSARKLTNQAVRLIVKQSAYDKIRESYSSPETVFSKEFIKAENQFKIDGDWNCTLNPIISANDQGDKEIIRRDLNCALTIKDDAGYVSNSHWIFESFSCADGERSPASGNEVKHIEYEYEDRKVNFRFECL